MPCMGLYLASLGLLGAFLGPYGPIRWQKVVLGE